MTKLYFKSSTELVKFLNDIIYAGCQQITINDILFDTRELTIEYYFKNVSFLFNGISIISIPYEKIKTINEYKIIKEWK